jgi:hypothetical protein
MSSKITYIVQPGPMKKETKHGENWSERRRGEKGRRGEMKRYQV